MQNAAQQDQLAFKNKKKYAKVSTKHIFQNTKLLQQFMSFCEFEKLISVVVVQNFSKNYLLKKIFAKFTVSPPEQFFCKETQNK